VVAVVETWLLFIISGLMGGLANGLLWARGWQDLKAFEFFRAVALGAIGGFLFYLVHTEWSVPNGVVAFIWGYAFRDIIEGLMSKVRLVRSSKLDLR
jgi:hypothetical protein